MAPDCDMRRKRRCPVKMKPQTSTDELVVLASETQAKKSQKTQPTREQWTQKVIPETQIMISQAKNAADDEASTSISHESGSSTRVSSAPSAKRTRDLDDESKESFSSAKKVKGDKGSDSPHDGVKSRSVSKVDYGSPTSEKASTRISSSPSAKRTRHPDNESTESFSSAKRAKGDKGSNSPHDGVKSRSVSKVNYGRPTSEKASAWLSSTPSAKRTRDPDNESTESFSSAKRAKGDKGSDSPHDGVKSRSVSKVNYSSPTSEKASPQDTKRPSPPASKSNESQFSLSELTKSYCQMEIVSLISQNQRSEGGPGYVSTGEFNKGVKNFKAFRRKQKATPTEYIGEYLYSSQSAAKDANNVIAAFLQDSDDSNDDVDVNDEVDESKKRRNEVNEGSNDEEYEEEEDDDDDLFAFNKKK